MVADCNREEMASRKKWTVRRTHSGSSAYLVERANPLGRSVASNYRFAKVARTNATKFQTETEATKVMKSMKRTMGEGNYSLVTL